MFDAIPEALANTISNIIQRMFNGGPEAVVALLILANLVFMWVIRRLYSQVEKNNKTILDLQEAHRGEVLELIEKYHQAQITTVQTLSEFRAFLTQLTPQLFK